MEDYELRRMALNVPPDKREGMIAAFQAARAMLEELAFADPDAERIASIAADWRRCPSDARELLLQALTTTENVHRDAELPNEAAMLAKLREALERPRQT